MGKWQRKIAFFLSALILAFTGISQAAAEEMVDSRSFTDVSGT